MNIAPGLTLLFIQAAGNEGLIGILLPMVVVFGIFYFLLIRPQQKKQKLAQTEREKMLEALKPGDKVVTTGGIYGTIIAVRESTVQLRIAQSVSIELSRTAVAGFQGSEAKEAEVAKA